MRDLTKKDFQHLPAKEKIIPADIPLGERRGGIRMHSTSFKRGSGTEVFGSDAKGIWLGSADFENAPFRADMRGGIFAKRLTLENFINDDHPSIVYTGAWARETVGVLFGGTRTRSNVVGNSFTISFFGTSIGLIMERANNRGRLSIFIDDVFVETIDLFSTTVWVRSVIWQRTNLTNTNHTLRGVIEPRNPSSIAEGVGVQGYTLFPHDGIKMEQLSCDLFVYGVNVLTDANGYAMTVIAVPAGFSVYKIAGLSLSEAEMSNTTQNDPKLAWRSTEFFLYNGAANTTYKVIVVLLLSKI